MWPEFFRIPGLGFPVYTYGLMLIVAFIVALLMTERLAAIDGIPKGRIYDLAMFIIPSALVGTRLLMVSAGGQEGSGQPPQLFSLDLMRSVGHYLGGFLTALVVSAIMMRVWHLPWRKTGDAFAPGLALGNVIGRVGCFAAGCCWGKPTASWMGLQFTQESHEMIGVPIGIALLPTQLIEASANLFIFAALLWLRRSKAFDGQIILAFVMLYSLERFTVEFWRADPRGQVMNLSTAQFISAILLPLAMIVYCVLLYQSARNKPDEEVAPRESRSLRT
jgi:phosphatidylglycerol:prolipoprotein diacylglycerol transferase